MQFAIWAVFILSLSLTCNGLKGGHFSIPEGCIQHKCEIFASWVRSGDGDQDDKQVTFHIEATSDGWAAIGLSADRFMGTDGIDDVLACQRDDKDDTLVYAKDMYNPQDQSSNRVNKCNDNQYAITLINSTYKDGRIQCFFSRLIITNNTAQDRHLNVPYYLFLAHGSARGSQTSPLAYHDAKYISDNKIDVTKSVSAEEGCSVDWMTRLHGILMFISFGVLMPLGIFTAAYMKIAMKKYGIWFQVHRGLMIVSVLFTVSGFTLIFVANRDTHGLITLGFENPLGTSHFVIGITVVFLQLANPIVGLLRCKPNSRFRPIFYLIHAVCIGYVVKTLGSVNIALGIIRFLQLANDRFYAILLWAVLSLGYFFIIDVAVGLYFRVFRERCRRDVTQEAEPLVASEDFKTNNSESQVLIWCIFTGVLVAEVGFGLAIIAFLAIGCY